MRAAATCSITLTIALWFSPLLAQPFNGTATAMQQQIVAKEREGLEALKSGNLELFGNLTAEDAVFVDSQGPATKAQVMKNVQDFKLIDYSMQDVKFVSISPASGLISYKAAERESRTAGNLPQSSTSHRSGPCEKANGSASSARKPPPRNQHNNRAATHPPPRPAEQAASNRFPPHRINP